MPTDTAPRPSPGLLLASQLVFNIGFYAVVPFLALVLTRDFGMTATAVGVVLGARVFCQQGLFLVGGMVTDRWGPRRAMLAGCLVRISGYLTLAMAGSFALFLLGAVLTGMGGALFSPALESLLGKAEERRRNTGGKAANFLRSSPSAEKSERWPGPCWGPCCWAFPSAGQRWRGRRCLP